MIIKIDKVAKMKATDQFKQIKIEEKNGKWILLATDNFLDNNDWRITQPYLHVIREGDFEKYIEFGKHLIQIEKIIRVDLDKKLIHIDVLENGNCRITYSNFINTFKAIEAITK